MLTVPEKIFAMTWIIGLSVVLALGCAAKKPTKPDPIPKFKEGEVIVSVLTGEKLMVMQSYISWGRVKYECRIGNVILVERDGLFSADTVSSRYTKKWFEEYELRAKED